MSLKCLTRLARVAVFFSVIVLWSEKTTAHNGSRSTHLPRDCSDEGGSCGVYLTSTGNGHIPTYCDMFTAGKRWVVILRREPIPRRPILDFNVNWEQYKWGFGSLSHEFWWGLEHVWRLTSALDREYELRIDMVDFDGNRKYAIYQNFSVSSEADGYRLRVGKFSGNVYDALSKHNGMQFTTPDRDNDKSPKTNCGADYRSGWWFNHCIHGHLTGGIGDTSNDGRNTCWKEKKMCWAAFHPWRYVPIKKATMLIRPAQKSTVCHAPVDSAP